MSLSEILSQGLFKNDLVPHAQLLLLFTTSAQTHIFPEIRIDAIRFLDLCLEVIPEVVVEGWALGVNGHGRRVLEGYLGILNAGTAYNESGGRLPLFVLHLLESDSSVDRNSIQATSTASVILSPAVRYVILRASAKPHEQKSVKTCRAEIVTLLPLHGTVSRICRLACPQFFLRTGRPRFALCIIHVILLQIFRSIFIVRRIVTT